MIPSTPGLAFVMPKASHFNTLWWYRQMLPARGLRSLGIVTPCLALEDDPPEPLPGVISLRAAMPQHPRPVRVVFDIDDDVWHPPPGIEIDAPEFARACRMADAVTVSTPALAESVRRFSGEVHVVPNALDLALVAEPRPRPDDGRVRIGWAGSLGHEHNLQVVQAALRRVLDLRAYVDLVLLGVPSAELMGLPRVEIHEPVLVSEFAAALEQLGLDIMIAPLADHPFNQAKSPLRLLHAAALGVPAVASPIGPYRVMPDGETGLLARNNTTAGWVEALLALVDDPARRRRMGEAARQWVRGCTVEHAAPLWRRALLG